MNLFFIITYYDPKELLLLFLLLSHWLESLLYYCIIAILSKIFTLFPILIEIHLINTLFIFPRFSNVLVSVDVEYLDILNLLYVYIYFSFCVPNIVIFPFFFMFSHTCPVAYFTVLSFSLSFHKFNDFKISYKYFQNFYFYG